MKVVVADTFEASGLADLKAVGCDVVYEPGQADDALAEAAVARINLDGQPPADLMRTIEQGNRDILSLHLVKI